MQMKSDQSAISDEGRFGESSEGILQDKAGRLNKLQSQTVSSVSSMNKVF